MFCKVSEGNLEIEVENSDTETHYGERSEEGKL